MINDEKVESSKSKKGFNLSIILVLVAGISIGYFENDIVTKSDETKTKQNNSNVESNSNVDSNSNVTSNQVTTTVETKLVSVIEDKNGVPYVNIKGLESINNEITKEYNTIKGVKNASLDYSYSVRNNVLVLWVEYVKPVAMDANIETKVYYIDLTTNKQISLDNAIIKLGLSKSELMASLVKAGYIENKNDKDLSHIFIIPAGDYDVILQNGIGFTPFINGYVE